MILLSSMGRPRVVAEQGVQVVPVGRGLGQASSPAGACGWLDCLTWLVIGAGSGGVVALIALAIARARRRAT